MNKKILIVFVFAFLLVATIYSVSAAQELTPSQTVAQMTNLWSKINYGLVKGLFLFTSWGQQNQCSVYPDFQGWVKAGTPITCGVTSSNQAYSSSNKCAIDVWYGTQASDQAPAAVNWNNWFKEIAGIGASFTDTTYPWYYAEVYSCPPVATPQAAHNTQAFTCNNGQWTSGGSFSPTQSCSLDTSGVGLCWCSTTTDNFYVDQSGGVHCVSPTFSNVVNGNWCSANSGSNSLPAPTGEPGLNASVLKTATYSTKQSSLCLSQSQCQTGSSCISQNSLINSGDLTTAIATSDLNTFCQPGGILTAVNVWSGLLNYPGAVCGLFTSDYNKFVNNYGYCVLNNSQSTATFFATFALFSITGDKNTDGMIIYFVGIVLLLFIGGRIFSR